ncbi:MAG: threonylcarbamoyl-AMP synthase [Alphaproteobacteria bacterium]|nr:threonylcarbamoyl-AMP synthase [Alphaproteobacteria bacterium]
MFDTINDILLKGGVIAFPTDTVWGVGCLPSCKEAVQRIYDIKHREAKKPLILMSYAIEPLLKYVQTPLPNKANELRQKYWPGALTLVLDKSNKTPNYITSNQNTVGIRVPQNTIFQDICKNISGHVLATTSANISGQNSALTYEEAVRYIGDKVDFVVPYQEKISGQASAVVRILKDDLIVLRQGILTF